MTSLAELFPDDDFRFRLGLRRGEPEEFFRASNDGGHLLRERGRWLAAEPERYSRLLPQGESLLADFVQRCCEWHVVDAIAGQSASAESPVETLRALGTSLEPDFLLLSPDDEGRFRLRGGALCFPTGWALEEKLGMTLDSIHGVVPGLNSALSAPVEVFLSRLKPGVAFQRDNWGITSSEELNQHPRRLIPAPALPVSLQRLWLRVEHQVLFGLPVSGGMVFGIRISLHRLDEIAEEPTICRGMIRALESMPQAMSVYKRLEAIRASLITELRRRVT